VRSTKGGGVSAPGWFGFGRAVLLDAVVRAAGDEVIDLPDVDNVSDVNHARDALHGSLADSSPFSVLAGNLGIDGDLAEVFALLVAAEIDVSLGRLVRQISGDQSRGRLTLGVLQNLFPAPHLGTLSVAAHSPLRRSAFVTIATDGPWADHAVKVHPGVIWALVGDGTPDPDLPPNTVIHRCDPADRSPGAIVADVVIANGLDRIRRRQAGALAGAADQYLCASDTDDEVAWAALVREASITGSGVIIDLATSLPVAGRRWIERATHLTWVVSAATGPTLDELPDRQWTHIEAGSDDPTDLEWATAFGPTAPRSHRLSPDQLDRVSHAFNRSLTNRGVSKTDLGDDIDDAVRRLASGRLETLTTRIRPTRTWDDVVVSEDRLEVLHGISDRYRNSHRVYGEWGFAPNPSRGLVALFAGPSGTGKTLTAEIIAGDLGLDLFKLDLSSVVSKYIGETEKNLEQIFDAASAGNMVLFFDEADSLFGKRSEVKDARDRYANIEVSYLLQRLESYDGLVILATNLEKNVDDAFLRRIHARVQFALPGPDERRAIWRRNFLDPAPLDTVDFDWLADTFELPGGVIRNAAVQAAFLAAQDRSEVGEGSGSIKMEHVVIGVARELRKMGRLLKESDFGEYHYLLG
jgi:AAA+ superfamily predicted ATPase